MTNLPPLPPGDAASGDPFWLDLTELVTRVNGFVYPGERTDAVLDTVKALRADPELADRLLDTTTAVTS